MYALERCDTRRKMWIFMPSGTAPYGIPVALVVDLSLPHLCFHGSYELYYNHLFISLLHTNRHFG